VETRFLSTFLPVLLDVMLDMCLEARRQRWQKWRHEFGHLYSKRNALSYFMYNVPAGDLLWLPHMFQHAVRAVVCAVRATVQAVQAEHAVQAEQAARATVQAVQAEQVARATVQAAQAARVTAQAAQAAQAARATVQAARVTVQAHTYTHSGMERAYAVAWKGVVGMMPRGCLGTWDLQRLHGLCAHLPAHHEQYLASHVPMHFMSHCTMSPHDADG
jgi:hypothetical protein